MSGTHFIVLGQVIREHETRAMLDGQIHDIGKVADSIADVKRSLEKITGLTLKDTCIAAAGRVLRTVDVSPVLEFEDEKEVTQEDIFNLVPVGIQQAYEKIREAKDKDKNIKFYCVGYSIVRYYLNDETIANPEGYNATRIGADMICTFLPEEVVDGLYKSCERAGLQVANMTLEPIAAISLAIPEKYRMLNLALIDVGAGTSDISITMDGSIVSYGMIPMAGDMLTETVAKYCLVDFVTADHIKRQASEQDVVEYEDIIGLKQTITRDKINEILKEDIHKMAVAAAEKIKECNGGKPVSAVFVVGGGGRYPGYTEEVAKELGIAPERVALRGAEVMQDIIFEKEPEHKDSLLVTPIGICLSYFQQSNNFIFVTLNDKRIKLYDNDHLTVADAAIQAEFPNEGLFPKRGEALTFTVNGASRMIRGQMGEAAVITINGSPADIHTQIRANDVIEITESTAGEKASAMIEKLPEFSETITFNVNDKKISCPKYALVNGEMKSGYYEIQNGDVIEFQNFYPVRMIIDFMDVAVDPAMNIYVNNMKADYDTPVYENFTVVFTLENLTFNHEEEEAEDDVSGGEDGYDSEDRYDGEDGNDAESSKDAEEGIGAKEGIGAESGNDADEGIDAGENEAGSDKTESEKSGKKVVYNRKIQVMVNGAPVMLEGKEQFVFVDVFDKIDFDLSKPQGLGIVTQLNGVDAQYMEPLKEGDVIRIYWKQKEDSSK
ncbi:MAG: rod shape-determining protein [Lachnospiraceae bacterium]|nr:rod shape-determining protein [Lachnospiraceae bacterium]